MWPTQCWSDLKLLTSKVILGGYPASVRNIAGSTKVPIRAQNNARKGTWGLSAPVMLKCRHMTYTVSMWHKTKSIKQTNYTSKGWKLPENIYYIDVTVYSVKQNLSWKFR
jgi:hypothetical protein